MYVSDFIKYISAPKYLGLITNIVRSTSTISVDGSIVSELTVGSTIRVQGVSTLVDIMYTVKSVSFSDNVTNIVVNESISTDVIISGSMKPRLYKGVDITNTTIDTVFDNRTVSFDDANIPIDGEENIQNNIIKFEYSSENSTVSCKNYGYILTPYEEQTEQEYTSIMNKLGQNNLSDYFKGMYELCTTFFSNLSVSDIDTHKTKFYNDMQNATIVDAGSFVIIPSDDQASVLVKSIHYFIDNYDSTEYNKIKFLDYGNSVAVTNPDGNEEIVTCARACTFTFN